MHPRYLVMSLAFLLAGCAQTNHSQHLRPGSTFLTSSGTLIEVGLDGKAHKVDLPLDQWPGSVGVSR
jgi:hypothetical protein